MKRNALLLSFFMLLLTACSVGSVRTESAATGAADMVFTNGKVYTLDADNAWAEAVALSGKDIVYVGDAAGAADYTGDETEVIDLSGKMLLPGFVDVHAHPIVAGGIIMQGIDLQSDDVGEILAKIRTYVEANPDLEVIQGYGVRFNPWNNDWPNAAMLDEIESERPVVLWTIDGHGGWVNSKALEMAGIKKDTPDPAPGFSYFERDKEGNPTGWIIEVPAQLQTLGAIIDVNFDYIGKGARTWLQKFPAAGVTSIQDLGLGGLSEDEGFQMFLDFEKAGELSMRVQSSYYWNNGDVDPVPIFQKLRETYKSELFSVNYLKVNMDGGDDKHNALYIGGYSDKPEIEARPIIPYDVINDAVQRADALGIDATCHCFGDLAVRKMLDALEMAIKANPIRDRRHYITHASLVHPDDRPRFAELGIGYDTTGSWMTMDPLMSNVTTARLGAERVASAYPIKAIHDLGGRVTLGSDWPAAGYVSEYRPLMGIEAAVTRQLPGREHVPPLGGEEARLPLDVAIKAYTLSAAYTIGMDDLVGSIEVGKRADLVVLEKNLFDIDLYDIGDTAVQLTMMNGKVTHRDGI